MFPIKNICLQVIESKQSLFHLVLLVNAKQADHRLRSTKNVLNIIMNIFV